MDRNKNHIPDWVENVIYWASVALLACNTYKKIASGELDITKELGANNGNGQE